MVRIPKAWHKANPSACRISWLLSRQLPLIEEFEMDRIEVTNKDFQKFVLDGGYENPKFWRETLGESWQTIVKSAQMQGMAVAPQRQHRDKQQHLFR